MKTEFNKYKSELELAMASIVWEEVRKAMDIIEGSDTVYVAGNGGSAAIANHLCCDFTKGPQPNRFIHTVSLVANTSMLTAIANDLGYENTISYQLNTGFDRLSDSLLLISSSGNSPNIVNAARLAKKRGHKVIGFTGFEGGALAEIADAKIHVESDSYGIVEDCHQAVMHFIARYLKELA